MSYYGQRYRYAISNHAITRARQRLNLKAVPIYQIHELLEDLIEHAICESSYEGDSIYKNLEHNVTIVVNERDKIIKTVY
ncbi:MAG: hypothetical protein HUJ42_02630 [Malacoplasma sp.]|nr:hypothetical protein [Malacoplasma sp.]